MSSQRSHNSSQASDDGTPTEYTLPTTVASFPDWVPGFEPVVEPTVTVYPIVQQDAGPPIQAPVRVPANQVQGVPTIAPVQPDPSADSGHQDVQMASDNASTTSTDLFLYGGVRSGAVAPDTQPQAANGAHNTSLPTSAPAEHAPHPVFPATSAYSGSAMVIDDVQPAVPGDAALNHAEAGAPPQQHFPVMPRRRAASTGGIPVLQTFPAGRGRKAASTGSMNASHIDVPTTDEIMREHMTDIVAEQTRQTFTIASVRVAVKNLGGNVDRVASNLQTLGGNVDGVRDQVQALGNNVDNVAARIDTVGDRVGELNSTTQNGFNGMRESLDGLRSGFNTMSDKFDQLNSSLMNLVSLLTPHAQSGRAQVSPGGRL